MRLYHDAEYVEVEYTVGPIDVSDGIGKEIIVHYDTDIDTNGLFFTDSNGREMQQRKINFRPTWKLRNREPVSGM